MAHAHTTPTGAVRLSLYKQVRDNRDRQTHGLDRKASAPACCFGANDQLRILPKCQRWRHHQEQKLLYSATPHRELQIDLNA